MSYVAQLAPPPARLAATQRATIYSLLHMPYNSLTDKHLMGLTAVGGPAIRCAVASAKAALMRYATRSEALWKSWLEKLRAAAITALPLNQCFKGKASMAHWKSPPFAESLEAAFFGWGCPALSAARLAATAEGRPVQKEMYKLLVKQASEDDWARLLGKRLAATTGDSDISTAVGALAAKALKETKGHTAMAVMKTMVNGWATTRRFHREKELKCIYGCGEPDDMTHYWRCQPMWKLVGAPSGMAITSYKDIIGPDRPLETKMIKLLAVAFTTYHSMIKGRPRCVAEADESGDYTLSLRTAAAIAATVARESRLAA